MSPTPLSLLPSEVFAKLKSNRGLQKFKRSARVDDRRCEDNNTITRILNPLQQQSFQPPTTEEEDVDTITTAVLDSDVLKGGGEASAGSAEVRVEAKEAATAASLLDLTSTASTTSPTPSPTPPVRNETQKKTAPPLPPPEEEELEPLSRHPMRMGMEMGIRASRPTINEPPLLMVSFVSMQPLSTAGDAPGGLIPLGPPPPPNPSSVTATSISTGTTNISTNVIVKAEDSTVLEKKKTHFTRRCNRTFYELEEEAEEE